MATITNLNIPILKQELNVSLRTENYAYVQSAIESRLNVPHSADIRTSLIQASKVVAANTAENYAEKTMWTDAAKETFVKLVSAATAYVVCDKLGFDAIDLEMEYNSLNAYEAMNDAVSKAANSISATVLRSVQRNISNSNMLIERNNENERNSLNESNSGSAVNDNANGERSVRDMELSRGQQGVEGDGGDRKKSITVSGTSREHEDHISGMERAAHIGDSNRQIRNNEKHISEEVSAGNIQQHGSERNADGTSGSNSGERGTRDEGLYTQSDTDGQSVRNSNSESGLRGESQDIRNASAASGGSYDKNVDPVGRDDVIGNVEYRYIHDKKYVKGETDTMLKVADRLEAENISFSGKINGDFITLTVSGSDLRDKVRSYLEEIKPQEKENSPVGNSPINKMVQQLQNNRDDDAYYLRQVDEYLNRHLSEHSQIQVCNTPNVFKVVGSQSEKIYINQKEFQNSINPSTISLGHHTSGHDIPIEAMLNIPEQLRNPVLICKGSKDNSLVAITELKNRDNKTIIVPMIMDTGNKNGVVVNKIMSVYGKDSIKNYLNIHFRDNTVLAYNKEKTDNLVAEVGANSPTSLSVICYDNSIAYTTENVKYPYNNSIDKVSNNMLVQESSENNNQEIAIRVPETDLTQIGDKFVFDIKRNTVDWWYFNPDGNDGNGQIVKTTIYDNNIVDAYKAMLKTDYVDDFMNVLYNNCRQEIIDNDGSQEFASTAKDYSDLVADYIVHAVDDSQSLLGLIERLEEFSTTVIQMKNELHGKNETEVENLQNPSETNAKLISNDSDNITVEGHYGTWYVIDSEVVNGKQLFLLESEEYGDETAALIVDENAKLVLDEVYNGFLDYHEAFDNEIIDNSPLGNLDEKDLSADIIYNFAANHMPEIIRHMNATDEMDDMTEIFTDSEEKRIEIAKKHIMSENIPTEVFNLYPDKNLTINVQKIDDGVKVFNGNNEIHFSWKQVSEFCVTAAENWTNSEDDRAYKYIESKYTYERIQAAIDAKTGIYLVNDENNEVRYLYDRDKDSYVRDNGDDGEKVTIYKGQEIDSISMCLQSDGYRVSEYGSSEITKHPETSLSRDEFIEFISNDLSGKKYIQNAQADEAKFRYLIYSGTTDMLYNLITEDEHIGNYTPKEMEKLFDLINNDSFERESLYNVVLQNVNKAISQQQEFPTGELAKTANEVTAANNSFYRIYQLNEAAKNRDIIFESIQNLSNRGIKVPDITRYDLMYEGDWDSLGGTSTEDKLETIYRIFNTDEVPENFRGHSLSVSDVVTVGNDRTESAYYVDSFGFSDVTDNFFEKSLSELQNTKEQNSPLGNNSLVEDNQYIIAVPDSTITIEQMEQYGYRYNESSPMLPLSKNRASELYNENQYIYKLFPNGSFQVAEGLDDLLAHNGMFGIHSNVWELYYMQHTDGFTALVKEMQKSDVSNKDLFDSKLIETINKSSDKEFADYMLTAREKYVDVWNDMYGVVVRGCRNTSSLPPFDRLRANHDFTIEQLTYVSSIENFININDYKKIGAEMLVSGVWQNDGGFEQINQKYFSGKLNGILNEINQYMLNEVVVENSPLGNLNAAENEIQGEQLAFEYVPDNSKYKSYTSPNVNTILGLRVEIDGREFVVDTVDENNMCNLRDLTFQKTTGFPVFRHENVEFVRRHITERQSENEFPTGELPQKSENKELKHNFSITDEHFNEDGGAKTKFKNNIEAISLLKNLEADNRLATPEEQEVLSKYVGWGGISQAFDSSNSQWVNEYAQLKEIFTESEYSEARASTVNAHYTSHVVINAIYKGLENLGFKGGRVLEPAMGTGNFFGAMPEDLRSNCKLHGVELDSVTGRIAKQLYQNADISITGFENKNYADNSFDVAVGNVPFGSYKLNDSRYNKENFYIHDYFFAKSLDKVKPGGVVAFVTSKGTLDKQNSSVRKYLSERAELLGAIRLPNNAFKSNAGTEVTADIIFLKKRERPIDITHNNSPEWLHLGYTDDMLPINQYFINHPEMVLGKIVEGNKLYGNQKNETMCVPIEGAELKQQLSVAIKNIQGEINTEKALYTVEKNDNEIEASPDSSFFSYTVVDDKLYYRADGDTMKLIDNEKIANRGKAMVHMRNTVHELLDLEISNTDNHNAEQIETVRKSLNAQYDNFVVEFGRINTKQNKAAFASDNTYHLLVSLENYDNDGKYVGKADIFVKNTIKPKILSEHVTLAADALVLSVAEKAKVDFDYMQQLTGKDKETLIAELGDKIFRSPDNDSNGEPVYVTADEYLTGNIRKKLERLDLVPTAFVDYDYTKNREALKMALPPLVDAADIDAKLGAAWIPPEYVQQFALEVFKVPYQTAKTLEVKYSEYTDKWNVSGYKNNYYNSEVTQIFGTPEMNAYEILEATLNMKPVNVKRDKTDENNRPVYGQDGKPVRVVDHEKSTIAQQKQQDMKRVFSEWAFKDPERREKLVKIFNEKFNSVRLREYDGDKLNFVGINPTIELRSHQKNAIARGLYSGNTLLAHEVGAGKTFEMIAIAMEGKRLGLHNKSMFAVPNSLTEQFAADFRLLYPNANILVATKKDFEKENRRTLMAKIATGDFDAVILGHSQFDRIHLSQEREEKYLNDELEMLRDALEEMKAESDGNKKSFSVKQIEQSIKNKEASLKKLQDKVSDDNVISFERLGIDKLFIDESHMYKNLDIHSKMRNVAGLGTKGSGRAFALLTKCKYLNEVTNNKGVVFASGTPVSNSMTELYTIMRYLQADKLAEAGIKTFDNWASIFAECVQSMELKPECDGKFQMKTRIQNYSCVEQLMTMYRECADIKTADMMNLERPDSEVENVVVPASRAIKREMKKISDRAKIIRVGGVLPTEDNMLKLTIDGKKVGLDLRLMDPNALDEPNSKVNTCVKKVTEIYNETAEKRGVQMIFCDLSTPYKDSNPNSYRVYKKDEYGDYSLAFSDKLIGKMNHESILKKFSSEKTLPKNYDKDEYGLIQPEDIILIHRTDELGNVTNEACCVENNGVLRQDVSDEWFDKQGLERYVAADSKPKFCVYDDIKTKLISNGIPEKEIAFIHDYDKAEDKQRLFSQMNEGKVRVMLGSTGKCGAGMNAQKKMVALHHLDAPARPSDMEQRNGRIVRQGNENKSVKIFRYVTDRTFDAYSYQILENKQKFISQVMTGKVKVKTCEDIDEKALDFGEVKALCAGNPLIKVKIDLETEINTLKIIKAGFDRQKYAMEDKVLHSLPIKIGAAEQIIEKIKSDIQTVKKTLPSVNEDNREYYPVEVNSKVYSDKEAAGAAIKAAMLSPDVLEGKEVTIGKYRGLELSVMFDKNFSKQFKACLRGEYPHYCILNSDPGVNAAGNITRLNNLINSIPDELEQSISKLEDLRSDLKATAERSQEVFPRQQELEEKERELIDVDAQLKVSEIGESNEDLSEIYESLETMFPDVLSGKETYIKLSAGECFDSLFVKQLSENQITVAHTYVQNGDLMYDPMITYEIDREKRTATAVEYENSGLGIYEVYTNSPEKQADCNDFTLTWLESIEQQGYERISEKEKETPKRDLQVAER